MSTNDTNDMRYFDCVTVTQQSGRVTTFSSMNGVRPGYCRIGDVIYVEDAGGTLHSFTPLDVPMGGVDRAVVEGHDATP